MNRTFTYLITQKDSPCTVESYLKKRGYSHPILVQLKKTQNGILVNQKWAYVKTILNPDDKLEIHLEETASSEHIVPVELPFSIVYEDEDILVVNKPADMPIHPSINNYENTLANGIAWYFAEKGEDFVYRCINRLDRDTTGALILAKNPLSAAILSVQMKKRQILRTYLALVDGLLPDSGTINAPIARMEGSVITREVNFGTGESAITHYERLAAGKEYSLAELHLETGRTHQIRVHMKYIGHPLPGDYLYNPDYRRINRQPLHSYQLEFTHPITGKVMLFTAPLPIDFISAFYSNSLK